MSPKGTLFYVEYHCVWTDGSGWEICNSATARAGDDVSGQHEQTSTSRKVPSVLVEVRSARSEKHRTWSSAGALNLCLPHGSASRMCATRNRRRWCLPKWEAKQSATRTPRSRARSPLLSVRNRALNSRFRGAGVVPSLPQPVGDRMLQVVPFQRCPTRARHYWSRSAISP